MLTLGVDIGTSSLKLGAIDVERGDFVGWAGGEYALTHPRPGWSELDAECYWRAFVESLRVLGKTVDLRAVKAICVSSQGQTFVPVDSAGKVLQRAWTWIDNRAAGEAVELSRQFGPDVFFRTVGVEGVAPGSLCSMIRYLRKNDPALLARTDKFLITSSFLIWRLCGRKVMDANLAAMSGMYDWHRHTWWPEMLDAVGIGNTLLPEVLPSGTAVETIDAKVAAELGLPADVVIVTGANDQTANALGAGLVEAGETLIVLGTALVVFRVLGKDQSPVSRGVWSPYPIPGRSYQLGYTNSGCGTLDWAKQLLAPEVAYSEVFAETARAPIGSEGVTCLIDLDGRAGTAGGDYRGLWAGLSRKTDRACLLRSVLEAVAFSVRELAGELGWGLADGRTHAVGGGARSDLWLQVLADVLGGTVLRLGCEQSGVLGGAIMAAVGAGCFTDYRQAVARTVRVARDFPCLEANHREYERIYDRFARLRQAGDRFYLEG